MGMNGRVVSFALHGLAQRAFRSAQFVLFEINPAETVEIGPVVRIFLLGLLHERFRLVKPYPQVAEHVAVVIQYRSVFWINGQHLLELFFGFVKKLLPLVDSAEEEPHHFVFTRLTRQHFRSVQTKWCGSSSALSRSGRSFLTKDRKSTRRNSSHTVNSYAVF